MAKIRPDFFLAAGQLRNGNEGLPRSSAKGSVATLADAPSWLTSPATLYLSVCQCAALVGGGYSLQVYPWRGGKEVLFTEFLSSAPTELLGWGAGGMRDKGCSRMGNQMLSLGERGKPGSVGGQFPVGAWSRADLRSLGYSTGRILARCKGLGQLRAPGRAKLCW